MNLQLGINWQRLYRTTLLQRNVTGKSPIPIAPLVIPAKFTSSVLICGANSTKAKPTWRLGFRASVLASVQGIGDVELKSLFCPLGASLHFINLEVTSYSLRVTVPKWFQNISVEIWQYTGKVDQQSETEFLEILQRIEGKVDSLNY